jgi:hypothetical protein
MREAEAVERGRRRPRAASAPDYLGVFDYVVRPCVEGKDKAAININELRIKPQDFRALIIVSPTFGFSLNSPVGAMELQNGSLWGRK